MKEFRINGRPLVPFYDMSCEDKTEYQNIVLPIEIEAETEEKALDEYHATQPIEVLDNWEIDCYQLEDGE